LNNYLLQAKVTGGYTLLELLVALVLLVMLSGTLYGTYFSVNARQ